MYGSTSLMGLTVGVAMGSLAAAQAPPPPIVGGDETGAHDSVGAFVADDGISAGAFCSGSLVSATRVVTAAHCVSAMVDFDAAGYAILFVTGEDLSTTAGINTSTRVVSAISHPSYMLTPVLMADIAVAALESQPPGLDPIPLNDISPADDSWPDDRVVHVGFGADDDDGSGTGVKRETTLKLTDYDGHFLYTEDVNGSNLCMGDSGGAALVEDGRGDWLLVGVNAFAYDPDGGSPRCEGGAAGSTRIDRNMDFIDAVLAGEEVDDDGAWAATSGDPRTGSGSLPDDVKSSCTSVSSSGSLGAGLLSLGLLAIRRRQGAAGQS